MDFVDEEESIVFFFNKCKRNLKNGGCELYQFVDSLFLDRVSVIIRGS